jgi:hypothetical protein
MIALKNNKTLEELLLSEAASLEVQGEHDAARMKLQAALNADVGQAGSVGAIKDNFFKYDLYPMTREFMFSWLLEEDIDWSDIPEFNPHYASITERHQRKKRRGSFRNKEEFYEQEEFVDFSSRLSG